MADINLNFGSDDLKRLEQILADLLKGARDLEATMKRTGKAVGEDATKAKQFAQATRQVQSEKKKLTAVEQEQLRLEKALERTQAKIQLATSKEARLLQEKQKQLRQINTQLRNGGVNTNSWSKALGSFQFKFNALGNIAANVLQRLSVQLKKFVTESLAAYDKQIKAERNLLVAMEGRKGATDRLIAQASQLQKLTLFGDEETIRAQALIAAFVNEEAAIRRIIPLVQDMAQAKGMDLAGAADLVAKTLGSSTNALSRYGIEVEGAVGSTERLDSLTRGLTDAFGGQAEAAALVDAQFTQLKNTIGDIQESIGEFINESIFFFRVQNNLFPKLTQNTEELTKAQRLAQQRYESITGAITTTEEAESKLAELREQQVDINKRYAQAVKDAANAKKGEQSDLIKVVESRRVERDLFNELIPLVEVYAAKLDKELSNAADKAAAAQKKLKEETDAFLKTLEGFVEDDQEPIINKALGLDDETLERNKKFYEEREKQAKEFYDRQQETAEEARKREEEAAKEAERIKQIETQKTWDLATRGLEAFGELFTSQKEKELSIVGDNAEKRAEIERKYAIREKVMASSKAALYGAQSILKTKAELGLPAAIPFMIADAVITAAQIGVIASQKFAKGGWVDGEPHSRGGAMIEAEGGEFVINKRSSSKYKDLIEAINQDDQLRIMNAMARDRKISIERGMDPYTKKMYDLMRQQEHFGEDNKYYYKRKGNTIYKVPKGTDMTFRGLA